MNHGVTGRHTVREVDNRDAKQVFEVHGGLVTNVQRYTAWKVVVFLLVLSVTFPSPLNLTGAGAAVRLRPVVLSPAPPSAAKIIHKWADYYGVDKDLAVRIAFAESGLNCKVQNKNSSAGGLFQFINSTFLNTQKRLGKPQDISRKYDCNENAELGIYLLSKGELRHWKASQSVWDRSPIGEPEFKSGSSNPASD